MRDDTEETRMVFDHLKTKNSFSTNGGAKMKSREEIDNEHDCYPVCEGAGPDVYPEGYQRVGNQLFPANCTVKPCPFQNREVGFRRVSK